MSASKKSSVKVKYAAYSTRGYSGAGVESVAMLKVQCIERPSTVSLEKHMCFGMSSVLTLSEADRLKDTPEEAIAHFKTEAKGEISRLKERIRRIQAKLDNIPSDASLVPTSYLPHPALKNTAASEGGES